MTLKHLGSKQSPLKKLNALDKIDGDLMQVFETAAQIANVQQKDYISTTTFVQALLHCSPGKIVELFQMLPEGALPKTPQLEAMDETSGSELLDGMESFSPCIDSALENLLQPAAERPISSEDVFVDIARYSGGKSTRLLRSKGVTKKKVESMVTDLGWELIEREEDVHSYD